MKWIFLLVESLSSTSKFVWLFFECFVDFCTQQEFKGFEAS